MPEWTARTLGWALDALGEKSTVRGVFVSCARCSFEIIGECTAFFPTAILIAAVLASPATWRARLLGLGLGIPALYLINLVRLVTLCYVYRSYPQAFETLHMLVWQLLMIFLTRTARAARRASGGGRISSSAALRRQVLARP